MHRLSLFAILAACSLATAQTNTTSVADVGLAIDGGVLTVSFGQACGPFSCRPFPAGQVGPTTTSTRARTVTVHGAPNSVYVLGVSQAPLATPCTTVPGIGNALILGQPITLLAFGVTSAGGPVSSTACRQGQGTFVLNVPNTVPSGFTFLLQALATSATTGGPAFTVALQGSVR